MTSKPMENPSKYIDITAEEEKLFPEHFGVKHGLSKWYVPRFLEKDPDEQRIKCEQDVVYCIEKFPLAKIMLNALEKAGCDVDLRRHFSCETCGPKVAGGYDARRNKIIICQNRNASEKQLGITISHELLHMYDNCRAEFDHRNLDHIACTEIRAAGIFHCSLAESLINGSVPFYSVINGFKGCVRRKAIDTLAATGRVDDEKATKIVDSVFDRCYNDLEPVGRRYAQGMQKISKQERCYKERHIYGYGD